MYICEYKIGLYIYVLLFETNSKVERSADEVYTTSVYSFGAAASLPSMLLGVGPADGPMGGGSWLNLGCAGFSGSLRSEGGAEVRHTAVPLSRSVIFST